MTPVKFGISFNFTAFNQAGALVHVYKDGSVLINHGGTEMGQGLHTKMLQVAATTLGVPLARVRLAPDPHRQGAQHVGHGRELRRRPQRRRRQERLRADHWRGSATVAAGREPRRGTSSSARPTSARPAVGGRLLPHRGPALGLHARCRARRSSTSPTASRAAEVEVDGFTGAYRTRRVDIVHDVGDSLSPLVDLGQIEGGFVQGAGWLTLEDLRWDESDGPAPRPAATQAASTYKLPELLARCPRSFNVALLEHAHEDGAVYGSKAVGEPPLMLAFSVREALRQAAAAFGPPGTSVDLASPATPEAVYWAIERARARRPHEHVGRGPARRRPRPAATRRPPAALHPHRSERVGPTRRGEVPDMNWLAAVERLRARAAARRPRHRRRRARPRAPRRRREDGRRGRRRRGAASGAATSRRPRWPGPATLLADGAAAPETLTMSLNDKARTEHGRQCCGGEVTLLLEPLPVVPAVAIFGVGHVGLELARILARHDLELHLVDSRAEHARPRAAGAASTTRWPASTSTTRRCPRSCSARCRAGTHVLVMTHDHAEDFALCDAALRCAHLGSIGLIGSAAKWRAVPSRGCAVEGHDDGDDRPHPLARSALPGLPGKEPATIAVGVAAELLHGSAPSVPRPRRHGPRSSTGPASSTPPTTRSTGGAGCAATTTSALASSTTA